MADLNLWKYKEISAWCHDMGRLSLAQGGRTFGYLKVRQLQAIAWYCTDTLLRGQLIDVDEFKRDPEEYRARSAFDYTNSQSSVTFDKPAKFIYKNWISWEKEKTNFHYLREMTGKNEFDDFNKSVSYFEIIWYGKRDLDVSKFEQIRPNFTSFLDKLGVK